MTSEEYNNNSQESVKLKQNADIRKRKLFLSALLFPIINITKQKANYNAIFSEIIGKEINPAEAQEILEIIKDIRKNFTKFPIEKLIRYIAILSKYEIPLKKIRKVILISSKTLLLFPYYSTTSSWRDIGYTGPFAGRANFERYKDPQISIYEPNEDEISFDICVIGSGAGGGISALELSSKFYVGVVEKGKLIMPYEFTEREEEMIPKLYNIAFEENFSIFAIYGKCVGGSTLHNTALFSKLPEKIFDFWTENGFTIKKDYFYRIQDKIFNLCSASKIQESQINTNGELVKIGMERKGINYYIPHHARKDCLGVGFCELGCHWNRKFSTLLYFFPEFQRRGGKIISEANALYLHSEKSRNSQKVDYLVISKNGKTIKIKAKAFVLSAGALNSPIILKKSFGIKTSGICLHPSTCIMGIFDRDIAGWLGIPISLISEEFLEPHKGFILMPYFLHPGTFAVATGGIGSQHREIMLKYKNIAMLSVLIHDRSSGYVKEGKLTSFRYDFTKDTIDDFKKGVSIGSEILLSAGAKEIILPHIRKVVKAKSSKDVDDYLKEIDISDIPFLSVHPQATISWGKYLDEMGRIRGFENLWIADASSFPASCGVPPQVTVMSISYYISEVIKSIVS